MSVGRVLRLCPLVLSSASPAFEDEDTMAIALGIVLLPSFLAASSSAFFLAAEIDGFKAGSMATGAGAAAFSESP